MRWCWRGGVGEAARPGDEESYIQSPTLDERVSRILTRQQLLNVPRLRLSGGNSARVKQYYVFDVVNHSTAVNVVLRSRSISLAAKDRPL